MPLTYAARWMNWLAPSEGEWEMEVVGPEAVLSPDELAAVRLTEEIEAALGTDPYAPPHAVASVRVGVPLRSVLPRTLVSRVEVLFTDGSRCEGGLLTEFRVPQEGAPRVARLVLKV